LTLHDSLMARLDRLGPAKEVIQIGVVIGSEFSYELLRAVYLLAELGLQAALAKLTGAAQEPSPGTPSAGGCGHR
jgi:predicted ATPase